MSLLSLLIAIMAERSLSGTAWQFNVYYQKYLHLFGKNFTAKHGTVASVVFILLPVIITFLALTLIDNSLIELILSTVILIICFGCTTTRNSYKNYLKSASHDEESTAEMYHQQLLSDKNLPQMGFGQALIWLNYRYYIAIMLFFTVFGAAGAVFYRLLTSVIEHKKEQCIANANKAEAAVMASQNDKLSSSELDSDVNQADTNSDDETFTQADETSVSEQNTSTESVDAPIHQSNVVPNITTGCHNHYDVLFWLDWLPVRIASFGYMLVGHFSKAMPVWLENLFDSSKPTHQILIDVAEKSEDIMLNDKDCTAEPCLLVRLAKRNVLLVLAVISLLTLTGYLN
ncbi:beta-lactamase regulator AmpE [Colwellia echini]|uniref:Beta-lactamase regulator AmpE n=1 Tax=Colwellia echini TaxID=1982103 RepID=A0ABY3MU57_9GAMM|nr:beta-lactamase regulator AmpE [Colwellia echini]TYK64659.1 beta-lactamase regulator AmpE [Colwellia echini]